MRKIDIMLIGIIFGYEAPFYFIKKFEIKTDYVLMVKI
jgi:hypothetical protein